MRKLLGALLALSLCACSEQAPKTNNAGGLETADAGEVNIYTHRHYDADQILFERFEEKTGIKVNVVKASADELMVRMENEGVNCPADVLVTVDAGRLVRAKNRDLLQVVKSSELEANTPNHLRDPEGYWFGQTMRARLIVYSKERVDPSELSTYQQLTDPVWKGKVLCRSGENIYNRSLLASRIAHSGDSSAKAWAAGIVSNMARDPKGNDRDQVKAIAAGVGDVAIVNSYYIGKLLSSDDPQEVKAGEAVGVFFPDQDGTGTHVNVSGAGVAKHAPNRDNAIAFLEYMASADAQRVFSEANQEYPVRQDIEASDLLRSWGDFKADDLEMNALGEYNEAAARIFDEVGWK